mgnify:CR=1 FL=1
MPSVSAKTWRSATVRPTSPRPSAPSRWPAGPDSTLDRVVAHDLDLGDLDVPAGRPRGRPGVGDRGAGALDERHPAVAVTERESVGPDAGVEISQHAALGEEFGNLPVDRR